MKRIGFTLIILGFIAAAWASSQDAKQVPWLNFIVCAVAMATGVVVVRAATRAQATHAETVAANIEDIDRSLRSLSQKVTSLNQAKGTINTYDMRHKIDETLMDDINTFVEARETIGTKYGLHAYADVMSHFAAGERYLNRVWSCSADGYIDEVNDYIGRADEQFAATLERFLAVRSAAG